MAVSTVKRKWRFAITSEKGKCILTCYWKTENVTEYRGVGEMNLEFGTGGGHFERL
jgi:hypothetical protein